MSHPLIPLEQASGLQGCVLTYGHFTTIHPGHIRYLRHARSLGQSMVVAVMGDGPPDQPSPYSFSQQERAEALSLLGISDAIVLLRDDELSERSKHCVQQCWCSVLIWRIRRWMNPWPCSRPRVAACSSTGEVHYASADLLTVPNATCVISVACSLLALATDRV